jgi:hypothetical protein
MSGYLLTAFWFELQCGGSDVLPDRWLGLRFAYLVGLLSCILTATATMQCSTALQNV